PAVGNSEEIEARHRDAWPAGAVVKRFHPEATHHFRRGGRKGHPDMADGPRAINICEHHDFVGLDPPARRTPTSPSGPTTVAAPAARILEGGRPAVEREVNDRGIQSQHELSFSDGPPGTHPDSQPALSAGSLPPRQPFSRLPAGALWPPPHRAGAR